MVKVLGLDQAINRHVNLLKFTSYNPFFGCEVGLLEWHGDEIVTVYREKHETLVAVFDIEAGTSGRLLPLDDDWSSECGTVWFLSNEPGLIEACRLPDLVPGVPSPFGVDAPLRRFVQKPDHDPDSFAAKVASLLFGSDSPQPIADVLIGSAAFRFWDSWPTPHSRYGFRRRWNSPYWFPFYWQKANDTGAQELLHSVLEKLAAQSFADVDMEDYPARMAAEHICRAAEDWTSVCELDSLPERCRCHFWVEWSQKEFVRSLNLFPRGFREAYTDIAESRKTKNGGFFNRLFGR